MKLYDSLKQLRLSANITQEQLANIIGVHRATYASYEQGRREPDYETLIKIAEFYKVSLDYLFERENNYKINIINKKIEYKSDLHKELIDMLNELPTEDLYMLKGYMERLYEKHEIKENMKKSS